MRIIALDWGERRVGVAVSDGLGITAQSLEVIDDGDYSTRIARIRELIKNREVTEMVIGMPFDLKGEAGCQAKKIESLAEKLKKEFQIPVYLQDERFSTKEVERLLISFDLSRGKRKKVRDKLASQVILQTFLDKKNAKV